MEPAPAAVDVTRNGAVILKSVQYKTGFLFQIWFGGNTDRWLCTLNNASTVIAHKMGGRGQVYELGENASFIVKIIC